MPAPATLHKLVFGGELAQTETWSCSIMFANGPDLPAADQTVAAALALLAPILPSFALINYFKYNAINPATGRYADQSNSHTWVIEPNITGQRNLFPPQCALVITHRTLLKRGPAHVGRIYLPCPGSDIQGDGRVTEAEALNEVTHYRTFMTALQTALGAFPIVWSQKYQTWEVITTLECGRVVDTQRRRRKSLVENAMALPLSQ